MPVHATNIHSSDAFKMALFELDLQEQYQTDAIWAEICEAFDKLDAEHGFSEEFADEYQGLMDAGDDEKLGVQIRGHMQDNYILAAFAIKRLEVCGAETGLVAWAAQNKKEFAGLRGEIALIRTLLWMGYEPDALSDETGLPALQCMLATRYGPGCHPRAIDTLLRAGADPNIRDRRGDTPLIFMSGNTGWNESCTWCFRRLVMAGADMEAVAPDGSTPLTLLKIGEGKEPHPERAVLIDRMELLFAIPPGANGKRAGSL